MAVLGDPCERVIQPAKRLGPTS
ncbi:rCG58204 [Rattus norvegicus]|uniref:RCG58204 n=1 Tax=Rattus norvegicus TaxID=10116 RepID=A6J3S7_RAT|nr:rCG58204 [Rattus norvegicus]